MDDTSLQVRAFHPDVTLTTVKKNNGIAGWNQGFKLVTQPYILVLDDDSCIESGLAEAVDYMEARTDVGILALQIVNGDGTQTRPGSTGKILWDLLDVVQ